MIRKSRDAPEAGAPRALRGSLTHPDDSSQRRGPGDRMLTCVEGRAAGGAGARRGHALVPHLLHLLASQARSGPGHLPGAHSWPPLCAFHGVGNALVLVGLPHENLSSLIPETILPRSLGPTGDCAHRYLGMYLRSSADPGRGGLGLTLSTRSKRSLQTDRGSLVSGQAGCQDPGSTTLPNPRVLQPEQ